MLIAIPDLHGRADLLQACVQYYPKDTHFVFLGDAIDRGPDSSGTVRHLMKLYEAGRATLLRGNHEAMLSTAVELNRTAKDYGDSGMAQSAKEEFENWLKNGGSSVVREYNDFSLDNVPEELLTYLDMTKLQFEAPGGRLCVHAAPMVEHRDYATVVDTALWARPTDGPFALEAHQTASVHGHTPLSAPTWVGQHLYTDLGAVFTGAYCSVDLETWETTVFLGWGRVDLEMLPQLVADKDGVIKSQPFRIIEL